MLELIKYPDDAGGARLQAIMSRRAGVSAEIQETVRDILRQVREQGDQALIELSAQIERVRLTRTQLRVETKALEGAVATLSSELRRAVEAAADNIRSFHARQVTNSWFTETGDGVLLGKKVTPVRRVGICAPAGEVPLFSSLMMAVIPAQVAGVEQICVVSPPRADGLPHPTMLATAHLLGVDEVYALGGAQAVGAMAYGTDTIAPVDMIVGPGSPYTVAAQQQVFGVVGIPLLPGPSEIVVLADGGADPELIAADLLSQAEHGWGVASVCITPDSALAVKVRRAVDRQLAVLPRRKVIRQALGEYGAVVTVPDLDTGMELLNRIAPEHAELLVPDPWTWLQKIRNCGAVFMGSASTEPVGDYFAGTNHILPTNGAARYASSLGVSDFLKTSSIISYSAQRLERVGGQIATLARAEELEAHARAVELRLKKHGERK